RTAGRPFAADVFTVIGGINYGAWNIILELPVRYSGPGGMPWEKTGNARARRSTRFICAFYEVKAM
ncbi:MAG TPA: hypothetical protein VK187_11645, partial [Geobacteraceae bacterium]|nr:hypothetical protein [Geobacteraceae bacterium]